MKKTILLLAAILVSLQGFCQNDINAQMVFVKGGTFFMGCDDPHFLKPEFDNEKPLHRVGVNSFYIQKNEVTNIQWRHIMGIYPPAYNGVDYGNKFCDNCPVVKVSWDDIQGFIKKLNEKTGKKYRLPTETEWEFAARGGKYSKEYKYAGSNKLGEVAWYGHTNGTTHPVCKKEPNEIGLYDMSGNVAEWCNDWYGEDYYSKTIDEINPKGPVSGSLRVVRGGSFYDGDNDCRSVDRGRLGPDVRQWNIGFRLALDY